MGKDKGKGKDKGGNGGASSTASPPAGRGGELGSPHRLPRQQGGPQQSFYLTGWVPSEPNRAPLAGDSKSGGTRVRPPAVRKQNGAAVDRVKAATTRNGTRGSYARFLWQGHSEGLWAALL